MNDDEFFERLRHDARKLQYAPEPFVEARVRARVASRIALRPSAFDVLARWSRAIAATLAAIALGATLALYQAADAEPLDPAGPEALAAMTRDVFRDLD